MKKQQNKQKLDEMEAAMLAASEEMKTRQQEMDSERNKKMKWVSLFFSLPLHLSLSLPPPPLSFSLSLTIIETFTIMLY